ncbi:MAG: tetratricopeptide repeat protein [Phycisphaerales bacterium]|nr:tetratricopeptide repeat protein [Phycisphaerales bacterium]
MAKRKKSKSRKKKGQLNTRLLMIIGLSAMIVAGICGALFFLHVKGSVSRNLHAGAAYLEEGNWDKAQRAYGRVVRKEPSNDEGINGLLSVYDVWIPETREHSQDLKRQHFGVVVHDMRYHPGDDARAITAMEMAFVNARSLGGDQAWRALQDLANVVREEYAPDSDAAVEALYYQAIARLALETERFTSERDDQGNVVFPGEVELVAFLDARPGDDEGMAQLAFGRMAVARRLGLEEQFQQEARNLALAEATFEEALAQNPDGPATLIAYIRHLLLHDLVTVSREERQVGTLTTEERDAVLTELASRLDQVQAVLQGQDDPDPFLLADFAQFVRLADRENGHARVQEVLQQYLRTHPDADLRRLELADSLLAQGDREGATAEAQIVLDAPSRAVAKGAAEQYLTKGIASKKLFDIAFDSWTAVESQDKAKAIADAKAARDLLVQHLQGDDSNLMIVEADGRVAFMEGDYRAAASKLEQASKGGLVDAGVLRINAAALEEIGQPGLAIERLEQAVQLRPASVGNRALLAGLLGRQGRVVEALQILSVIPERTMEGNPAAVRLRDSLRAMLVAEGQGDVGEISNPVLLAITQANALYKDGKPAEARDTLLAIIETHADDPGILGAMVAAAQFHSFLGEQAESLAMVDRAIAIRPDDDRLQTLRASLAIDDPIERVLRYVETNVQDPAERSRMALITLGAFIDAQSMEQTRLERAGELAQAAELESLIARAQAEVDRLGAEVGQSDDGSAATLLVQFRMVISEGRFEEAEQMLSQARELDADQAGGNLLEGALLLARFEAATSADDPEAVSIGQRAVATARRATQEAGWNDATWQQLGRVLHATGDTEEARLAWAEASRRDPTDPQTARSYAHLLLLPGGEPATAARVLRTAAREHRGNAMLVEDWLTVEGAHGDVATAIVERRLLDETEATRSRLNTIQLATLLVTVSPTFDMIGADGASITARQWLAMSSAEQDDIMRQFRVQWRDEASALIDRLGDTPEATANMTFARANVLNTLGRPADMIALVSSWVDRTDAGPDRDQQYEVLLAAQFLLEADRSDDAVAFMRARRDLQDDSRKIDAGLGGMLASLRRPAEAEPFLRDAVDAGDEIAQQRLVEVLLQQQRLDEAKAIMVDIEARAPEAYQTAMLQAIVHRAEQGRAEIANDQAGIEVAQQSYRDALELAARRDTTSVTPYLELIASLIREYRRTIDRQVLESALRYAEAAADINPDVAPLAVQRAFVLEALGEPRQAASDLEAFLRRHPDNDDVRIALAQMHVAAGTPDRARRVLSDAIANGKNPAAWRERLAMHVMRHHRDTEEASRLLARAWQDEPTSNRMLELRRLTLLDAPWDQETIYKALQSHEDLVQRSAAARGLQARTEAAQGLRDHARETLRESWVLTMSPTGAAADITLLHWFEDAVVVFRHGDPAAGDAFLESVVQGDQSSQVLAGLAHFHSLRGGDGDLERADMLLQRSIGLAAANERYDLLRQHGSVQLRLNLTPEAIATFRELVEMDNQNPVSFNNLAWLLATEVDSAQEAMPLARRAVELAPDNPAFMDTLVEVYERLGNHRGAMTTRQSQLRLQPNNPALLKAIASAYVADFDDAPAAAPFAERVLELSPRDPSALDLAGWVDFKSGKAARAEDRLKQSIRRQPSASAHVHLAQVLAAQGRNQQALDQLRQAEALSTDQEMLDQIIRIRSDLEGTG